MDRNNLNTPQSLLKNGQLVRKPEEMANLQMDYYQEKIKKCHPLRENPHRFLDRALSSWDEKDNVPIFQFREISLSETFKLISILAESSAFDKIDSIGIKAAASQLVNPIQHIINTAKFIFF